MNINIDNLHLHVSISGLADTQTEKLLTELTKIEGKLNKIMLSEQELDDLLTKIDTTTNHTAQNIQTIADVDQQISNEIDAFLAATPVGTVLTQAQADKLQALADKGQAASDAGDAQVNVLKAIAAKGAPVVPPTPTPVVIP